MTTTVSATTGSKPLLVGESNPYGSDPKFALYPEPRGASGDRLCRMIMGLSDGTYMARFDRVNLCVGRWSMPEARKRASELLEGPHEVFVLLGAKVRAAFLGAQATIGIAKLNGKTLICLHHPSGLCRAWGVPGAVEEARALLAEGGAL